MQLSQTIIQRRATQLGATMVSVMLLTVSLMTVAVLVIRSSNREVSQANALVARERAMMAAQATIELGVGQYRLEITNVGSATMVIDEALLGQNQGNQTQCTSIYDDCIPGGLGAGNVPATGQKNRWVTGRSDCAGRPCMRQGAVVRLPDVDNNEIQWVNVPMRDLLEGGDPEARVSLWVRNNTADALDDAANGTWTQDGDGRVVLTAMATVRNTTVAIEQEFALSPGDATSLWNMSSPDVGYGGGHNNDNVMADVCVENFLGYEEN